MFRFWGKQRWNKIWNLNSVDDCSRVIAIIECRKECDRLIGSDEFRMTSVLSFGYFFPIDANMNASSGFMSAHELQSYATEDLFRLACLQPGQRLPAVAKSGM